jgi:hypothetical protein
MIAITLATFLPAYLDRRGRAAAVQIVALMASAFTIMHTGIAPWEVKDWVFPATPDVEPDVVARACHVITAQRSAEPVLGTPISVK